MSGGLLTGGCAAAAAVDARLQSRSRGDQPQGVGPTPFPSAVATAQTHSGASHWRQKTTRAKGGKRSDGQCHNIANRSGIFTHLSMSVAQLLLQ